MRKGFSIFGFGKFVFFYFKIDFFYIFCSNSEMMLVKKQFQIQTMFMLTVKLCFQKVKIVFRLNQLICWYVLKPEYVFKAKSMKLKIYLYQFAIRNCSIHVDSPLIKRDIGGTTGLSRAALPTNPVRSRDLVSTPQYCNIYYLPRRQHLATHWLSAARNCIGGGSTSSSSRGWNATHVHSDISVALVCAANCHQQQHTILYFN